MFAVLKTGGKQYKVQAGDVLRVELIAAPPATRSSSTKCSWSAARRGSGRALRQGAAVQAEVIDEIKADKVITFWKRRRKHSSQRTRGHRQKLTLVRVTDILASGAEKSGVAAAIGTAAARVAAHNNAPAEAKAEKKAAPKKAAAKKAETAATKE